MKHLCARCLSGILTLTGLGLLPSLVLAGGRDAFNSARQRSFHTITVVDQHGLPVPNARPSATSQIVDVAVGPGGQRVFSPETVNLAVGDTVRWTWASSGHSVTSGESCAADSEFCSPDDMDCQLGNLSGTGTVYQHTFAQAGTYFYFCAIHCFSGMTGTVNVTEPCIPPPTEMAGWWSGDGHARDLTGGNNGALLNGTTFAPGKVGQAFSFDGDDSVVVRHNPNQNGANEITIDAWINLSVSQHGQPIANKRFSSNNAGYTFETTHSPFGPVNGLSWVFWFSGVPQALITPPGVLTLGTFQHVAATYDGSTMRIFVDGVQQASMAVSGSMDATTAPLVIGRNSVVGTGFNGLIDELELINRALSQPELAAIVNAGSVGKCRPPLPVTAISRRTHGGAGPFDIDLTPTVVPGIECRSSAGGVYQMIAQFANPVTVTSATLAGTGAVTGFSVAGSTVTVDLNGITNLQTALVKLNGVSDGSLSGDTGVAMSVLVGDTNGSGGVSAADVGQTKGQSGQSATGTNFRTDVNVSGSISAADIGQVKSQSGAALP